MKISVVTNAFNQGRFLRRCLESVLTQDGCELEYIVIDPGSTDQTAQVLAEYEARGDARLRVLREPDKGPADGLNKGFAVATGDWFIYINADDFLLPGALRQAAAAIAADPQADCIYADGYLTDIDGRPTRRVISEPFSAQRAVWGQTLVLQQSTLYRAEAFRAVGGFNTENRTSWDLEILIDMDLQNMRLMHVNGLWSAFVIHGDSITGSQRQAAESRKNHERMFEKVIGRARTQADERHKRRLRNLERLRHPGRSLIRLIDQLRPQALPVIAAHLPPVEL